MIRESGEIESEDEANLDYMPPLVDAPIGDEEFGVDHGEMLGLVVQRALSSQLEKWKKKYSGRTSFTLIVT